MQVDQTPDEFKEGQNFFLRSLPPAVALYLAAVLRHTVAPKSAGRARAGRVSMDGDGELRAFSSIWGA